MKLDPDCYQCPDHQVNLTEQVSGTLEDAGPPVAYRDSLCGALLGKRRTGPAPFQVIVTCPARTVPGNTP